MKFFFCKFFIGVPHRIIICDYFHNDVRNVLDNICAVLACGHIRLVRWIFGTQI